MYVREVIWGEEHACCIAKEIAYISHRLYDVMVGRDIDRMEAY